MFGQVTEVRQTPKARYVVWIALFVILVVGVSLNAQDRQNLFSSFGSYFFWVGLAFVVCFGFAVNRIRFKRWI